MVTTNLCYRRIILGKSPTAPPPDTRRRDLSPRLALAKWRHAGTVLPLNMCYFRFRRAAAGRRRQSEELMRATGNCIENEFWDGRCAPLVTILDTIASVAQHPKMEEVARAFLSFKRDCVSYIMIVLRDEYVGCISQWVYFLDNE